MFAIHEKKNCVWNEVTGGDYFNDYEMLNKNSKIGQQLYKQTFKHTLTGAESSISCQFSK